MESFFFLILCLALAGLLSWVNRKRPSISNPARAAEANLNLEASIKVRRMNEFPRLNN